MRRLPTKTLPVTLLAAGALVLSGCSGGGPGGEYYGKYNCSTDKPCEDSGNLVRVTLDGDDVTFDTMLCDGEVSENDQSIGVLNEAQDTVAWTLEGKFEGNSPFTANAAGDVLTMVRTTYSKEGTDAADALLDEKAERCD